jgi:hypothetical protein
VTKVYCPECGHQNTEGGKYCSKCGAHLPDADVINQSTIKYKLDIEEKDTESSDVEDIVKEGISLAVRSGGGRAGEVFTPSGEQTTIGRSPGSDVFLDDITVSRNHAFILRTRAASTVHT